MISDESPNKLKATPELVGGVGELVSNSGTQYYQQDRVYSAEGVAMCHPSGLSSGSYLYIVGQPLKKTEKSE